MGTLTEPIEQQADMAFAEFPWEFVPVLRCSRDAGLLVVAENLRSNSRGILEARLRCEWCAHEYAIQDGIARLLYGELTPENAHEIVIRDVEYAASQAAAVTPSAYSWRSELSDQVEIPPVLTAMAPLENSRVLEFGCGDGRLTILMGQLGARVLAVDFSRNALRKLSRQLPLGMAPTTFRCSPDNSGTDLRGRVGLVQADASQFHVAPRAFSRALAFTPLDSRDERMLMYRTIADALTDDGRYIGSVEHDDLNRRLLGLPLARRYSRDGILIEHLTTQTMRREAAPYFSRLRIRPIRPRVPFVAKLARGLAIHILRFIAALPMLRQFGELLLLTAERPVRLPVEGEYRSGSRVAKSVYRSYMHKKDQEASWGEESV